MKITRRQFGIGMLIGTLVLFFGRLFGGARYANDDEMPARHWRAGDRLAG